MISVTEARKILETFASISIPIQMNLTDCLGKILAEDVFSPMDVPSFDNSAMDGYALQFDGIRNHWSVKAEIKAGDTQNYSINNNEAVRIFTGAKLPEYADTVIPQELIELGSESNVIHYLSSGIAKGAHVRYKGEQCKKGDKIIPAGHEVRPGTIGLLATMGVDSLTVFPSPAVAIIVTGDELKELGQPLNMGEIYNSNGPFLEASLRAMNIETLTICRVKDEKHAIREIFDGLSTTHDFIILSGGISVGEYDFVREALLESGVRELIYKVKQKPGKPLFVGHIHQKLVFALPGNPASVASCFNHYIKPCLSYFMGHENVWQAKLQLPLGDDFRKKPGLTFFLKARQNGSNVLLLTGQQSFNMLPFAEANCFVEIPEDAEFVPKNTLVNIYDWL